MNIEITSLKSKLSDTQKKLISCEKKIEVLTSKNLDNDKDQLRISLNETIRDNEEYKRKNRQKENEIERLKDINQKLSEKLIRVQKKLDALKTRKK